MCPLPPPHWIDHRAATTPHAPSDERMATLGCLARMVFATEDGPPSTDRVRWFVDQFDDFMGRAGSRSRLVVGGALLVVDRVAPLLALRAGPLGRLTEERRRLALERLERSPLGITVLAAKAAMCIVWFEHPDAAREIGFDGLPLKGDAA